MNYCSLYCRCVFCLVKGPPRFWYFYYLSRVVRQDSGPRSATRQAPPPQPPYYCHTKILLWEELRIAVWTSHWAALQDNLKAPVGSFPSPCAFFLSSSSWITCWINILLLEQNKPNYHSPPVFGILNQIPRSVFIDAFSGWKKNKGLQIFLIQAFICKKPWKE